MVDSATQRCRLVEKEERQETYGEQETNLS